ncbi:MAG: hypothetical protein E4H15_01800 [Syntrophobacterales bacterium]|nr:MAG: hypothetical protein E4H15_01800 [Syntrophobacterales bacterium]
MTDQDPFLDFCLWDYKPVAPHKDKFRPASLLFHSFEIMGVNERMFDLVQAIRKGIGRSHTVWGLKQLGENIFWEFYFYDYRRRERERSITKILDIIKPFIRCEIKANENFHYFMFSIDINNDLVSGTGNLEEIHMYIGNPGSSVSSGICYSLTNSGMRLENFYFFFDAKKKMDDILSKIACSAHIDSTEIGLDQILWPEMRDCEVIVVANKQENDAIYFSRIKVDQLIYFLRRLNYRSELTSFVEENRSKLDHLLFDAGYDYRMEGKELTIIKSGYYSIF